MSDSTYLRSSHLINEFRLPEIDEDTLLWLGKEALKNKQQQGMASVRIDSNGVMWSSIDTSEGGFLPIKVVEEQDILDALVKDFKTGNFTHLMHPHELYGQ